ncbi:hypothetical protein [Streptomyces sp. NBC_01236]|uniref:hypothetical protein n=1 Tax=Streptomyces sp. NBC_01236 TaxID=2903789 RepID=UPI002E0F414F|nr:hypothetical protein OG324_00645 [Streptomyces sp. NBC_01236]
MITSWVQLPLFTLPRDFRQFDRERHADLANPWLVRARQTARALGEARGWSRWIASDVDRALVIVLSGYCEGESIRYSELFPALRVRGLPVVRTAEVLDRLGLFSDDRAPAVDRWLERKLHEVSPGIRRDVEAWVRTLLDGGPRSEPRARQTAWTYLNEIQPVLLEWSGRYDHLREVTRQDIATVRDAATGKQRESRIGLSAYT